MTEIWGLLAFIFGKRLKFILWVSNKETFLCISGCLWEYDSLVKTILGNLIVLLTFNLWQWFLNPDCVQLINLNFCCCLFNLLNWLIFEETLSNLLHPNLHSFAFSKIWLLMIIDINGFVGINVLRPLN